MDTLFIDVIVPLAVRNLFTYRVPRSMTDNVQEGVRVVVPFGKRKKYAGLIRYVHTSPPEAYQAKLIEAVLDDAPIVTHEQYQLWEWISTHYMCTLGEVMNAALPSSLKLASETRIALDPEADPDANTLTEEEHLVLEALEVQELLHLEDLAKLLEKKTVRPVVRSLMEKGLVVVEEEVTEGYKPRMERVLFLTEGSEGGVALEETFEVLEKKAPKQMQALLAYLQLAEGAEGKYGAVRKASVREKAQVSPSCIDSLVEKGILEEESREVGRLREDEQEGASSPELTRAQKGSMERVWEGVSKGKPVLIHGVTSSGKTEVYVQAIQEALERGEQVLYLVPEIALTTQLVGRVRNFFGDRVGVYHSKQNDPERVEVWKKVGKGPETGYGLVLGARSSVFLPFHKLGLIIVDEEHESSYKQFDPAPRYNGRDVAMILGRIHQAGIVLGSATPSLEVYYRARSGDLILSELKERYGGVRPPSIECADLRKELKRKTMQGRFSTLLMERMKASLKEEEQVILFQNRRGFAPLFICEACGWSPGCSQCDISLTYHKSRHRLACHYCGHDEDPPTACGHCGSARLEMVGFGTEQIEEELATHFPEARVARMDLDTTRSRYAYQRIIRDMAEHRIDILVGTQMVTKGLDFGKVGTVGILNADAMLRFPDFRAHERAFQMMMQVSGRAGRRQKRGQVVIQTYDPDHTVIQKVMDQDHEALFEEEIQQRQEFHYPPFWRLIEMRVQHRESERVDRTADELVRRLRELFGGRVLGPEYPPVPRVRNRYRKRILFKYERKASASKVRDHIRRIVDPLFAEKEHKAVRLVIDVDPV
ncbi:MAG: primosomal protein N' [Flavobacteriales bacterium]